MKFYVHKLGCPKNDVDADYIAARLIADGHEPAADPRQAESILVNTCGFILPAKEESINELLRLGQLKKEGRLKTLYAVGCLAQRYGHELLNNMPELDGAFGLGAIDSLAEAVNSSSSDKKCIKNESHFLDYINFKDRFVGDSCPYAYLKISDGCNRGCSYCAIPDIRGRYRSRPVESIVREAEFLASKGKKELILVSQEATMYGIDLKDHPTLIDLLQALESIEGIKWIRVMYLHPAQLDLKLIEYLADDNKTLNYFDLPIQHVNSDILLAMGRQIDRAGIELLLRTIRTISPKAVLRTNFIVGFPGETQGQFEELKDFVAAYEFDRMGVFTYSFEEGTPAAVLGDQIPERVKAELQRGIVFAKNESLIGTVQEVIIDSMDGNTAVGRTRGDSPEIDQEIYVRGEKLVVGDIINVRIDSADGYDLYGTKVEVDE
ncbi:MAG: 30S ribosomal protein S12 methylthiotransferase RimO [Candidatus Zixiibacteriota bacterium]